jgi:hypothetical protein
MLQFKHSFNQTTSTEGDPVHEYQDIQLFNNSTGDTQPIPCIFNQTKLTNVVDKADEYYISVVRWSADCILPQIIPEMQLAETNTIDYFGLTNWIIGIKSSNGENRYTNVKYNPLTYNGISQPKYQPTSQNQVFNNPYYWISNIFEFCQAVNDALAFCVNFQPPPAPLPAPQPWTTPPTQIPLLNYNVSLGKLEFLLPELDFGITKTTDLASFYVSMNTSLYNILNTFNFSTTATVELITVVNKIPETTSASSVEVETILYGLSPFYDYGRNSFNTNDGTTNSPVVNILTQTNTTIPSMSPVNSIVFQTTAIPVNNTMTGAPAFLGANLQNNNALENNAGVLTDFQVPLVSGTEYSGSMLYYVPSGEYRLLDLTANTPIKTLNIQVYWLDKIGNSHPFLIKNQGGASLKLMFRKKSYNGTL